MKKILLLLVILTTSALSSIADEAPKEVSAILETLLSATQNNDLKMFESVCDDNMKEAMTEDTLTQVSKQLSDLMKQGYKQYYLSVLDRVSAKTYCWKIDFDKEGIPDMLAELSMSKGKVAGFYIR